MNPLTEYKGYYAYIRYEDEDGVYVGTVKGISDLISFHGDSFDEAVIVFRDIIEDYLDMCKDIGKEPNKTDISASQYWKNL